MYLQKDNIVPCMTSNGDIELESLFICHSYPDFLTGEKFNIKDSANRVLLIIK